MDASATTVHNRWWGLRPSVLGQDRSETKKIGLGLARHGHGLGLAGLVLHCETRSCHARRHNDLEWHSNFSNTIYSFSILVLEHHYRGDQQWCSLPWKLNPPSACVYFRWSRSRSWYFGLGLVSSGLGLVILVLVWSCKQRSWSCYFGLGVKNLVLFSSLAQIPV